MPTQPLVIIGERTNDIVAALHTCRLNLILYAGERALVISIVTVELDHFWLSLLTAMGTFGWITEIEGLDILS